MDIECGCKYCQMGIVDDVRDEMRLKFMTETLALHAVEAEGFIDTLENRECIANMISLFDLSDTWDIEDLQEEDKQQIVNEYAFCFNQPFQFYHATKSLIELRNLIFHALDRDTSLAATPILSKIITPTIFIQYFKTEELPQEVMDIIDKAEAAEQHSTVQ